MKLEQEIPQRWIRVATHKEQGGPYDHFHCRNKLMEHFCQDCIEKAMGVKIEYRGYGSGVYLDEGVCEECGQTKPMVKEKVR